MTIRADFKSLKKSEKKKSFLFAFRFSPFLWKKIAASIMMMDDEGLQLNEDELWDVDYDDLELEEEVASGAFGCVYKGSYCGTPVAVKQLYDADNEIVQKLMVREVEILKSLRHPNVVQFMGLCNHETGVYIVTEFVAGGNLWSLLKDDSVSLSWLDRVQFGIDVSQAMSYLHRRKLLHRDLKTKNLLVDAAQRRVKVCDFGFARTTSNAADDIYATKTGTGLWMAPEMYMGLPYSSKADVFSFGVIMREVITRTKPPERFPKDNFGFSRDAFVAGVPSSCPPKLLELALMCADAEPERRPTFAQVLRQLKLMRDELRQQETQEQHDKDSREAKEKEKEARSVNGGAAASSTTTESAAQRAAARLGPPARPPRNRAATVVDAGGEPPISYDTGVEHEMLANLANLEKLDARSSADAELAAQLDRSSDGDDGGVDHRHMLHHQDTTVLLSTLFDPASLASGGGASSSSAVASASSSSSASAPSAHLAATGSSRKRAPSAHALTSMDTLNATLDSMRAGSAPQAQVPPALEARFASMRKELYQAIAVLSVPLVDQHPALHESLKRAIKMPTKLNKTEWIVMCCLESYRLLLRVYGAVRSKCTEASCPTMAASESIHYQWADGVRFVKPINVPACQYVDYLNQHCADTFANTQLFPPSAAERLSRKAVLPMLRVLSKRLFRILSHIYFCHWSHVLSIDCEPHFHVIYALIYHIVVDFRLVDRKADSTTLEPLNQLARLLKI
jgi:serine/threonine protein kinase